MFARFASAALGLTLLAASPAYADRDHHRHRGHHGHGHYQKWQGYHGHGRHHWNHGARIVIWQPAPVYRAYPAPYPVYVPAPPPPVVHAPMQAVPLRSYQDTSGRYCREYQRVADIGGQPQQVYGTACMMPDGSWQIVSE